MYVSPREKVLGNSKTKERKLAVRKLFRWKRRADVRRRFLPLRSTAELQDSRSTYKSNETSFSFCLYTKPFEIKRFPAYDAYLKLFMGKLLTVLASI